MITVSGDDSLSLQDELVRVMGELLELQAPAQPLRTAGSREPGAQDYCLQGRGYLQSGDKAGPATEVLLEALKRDPKIAQAHAALGQAYLQQFLSRKDPEWIRKARASCQEALRLSPQGQEGLITLSMIARAEGRYEESASLLQNVIQTDPQNRDAWSGLAQAYEQLQRKKDAESAYRKAIELQPDFPGGSRSLGDFYYHQARSESAPVSFERARQLTPEKAS